MTPTYNEYFEKEIESWNMDGREFVWGELHFAISPLQGPIYFS